MSREKIVRKKIEGEIKEGDLFREVTRYGVGRNRRVLEVELSDTRFSGRARLQDDGNPIAPRTWVSFKTLRASYERAS